MMLDACCPCAAHEAVVSWPISQELLVIIGINPIVKDVAGLEHMADNAIPSVVGEIASRRLIEAIKKEIQPEQQDDPGHDINLF